MVQLVSIIFFKYYDDKAPIILASAYELSSFGFFQRGSVREVATFASREIIGKMKPGERCSIDSHGYKLHAYVRPDKLACAITSDEEYQPRVAFTLMHQGFEEFLKLHMDSWGVQTADASLPVPKLDELLVKFQNPAEADKVAKIQNDLDQTKDIIIKSMEQLMDRGEK
jgi:synaptobrevin family protein YKT6